MRRVRHELSLVDVVVGRQGNVGNSSEAPGQLL